ncbi:hypothetical protein NBRC116601_11770 [Cognatishimia sp. WU-CL00825]|uniref:hypothetical protein n=1 Tax=Cognatishimia sp. WU-CL00825 TaxID=3127658 RepID=UPI0031059824
MTTKLIYGPRATELRKPETEQTCAGFVLDLGGTDMMRCDAIQHIIQTWCDEGGDIATACGRVLDMERAEYTGEANVYDTDGKPLFLEPVVPLIRVEDCWGESPRRCINHLLAKLGQTSQRRVSGANLPRYFWVMVAMQIFDLNFS